MSSVSVATQQPIGYPLPDWRPRPWPPSEPMTGRYCRLEPLDARRHGAQLHAAYSLAPDESDWTYMSVGPFANEAAYLDYVRGVQDRQDPQHFAVIESSSGQAVGTLAAMRIDRANGTMEVGAVAFSPRLKRTPAATEAQYLMMRRAFEELGYRRYEWKCDSLNAASRAAALRLGFQFEGIFRQALVYKGRNRDTAWFSIIDQEWPALRRALEQWLSIDNFDDQGRQRRRLAEAIAACRQGNSAG